MSTQSKRFLTFLLCAAIVSNFGCTTTAQRVEPSQGATYDFETRKGNNVPVGAKIEDPQGDRSLQAAMGDFGIGEGDNVPVRYTDKDNPKDNPKEQPRLCKIFYGVAATLVQLNNIARGDPTGVMATLASIEHYRSK
ncbi:MAG: hypothetical protein GQ577_06195 [Woeseiaceae bacterium]|nr:hypothetical protein [Woeseiaceae bacterium]